MKYVILITLLWLSSCGVSKDLYLKQETQLIELTKQLNTKTKLADSLQVQTTILNARIEEYKKTTDRLKVFENEFNKVRVDLITSEGNIELVLFPGIAPLHVLNFARLSEAGFYDGVLFHRVIEGFMIQSGDPNTKTDNIATHGQGGATGNIPEEFGYVNHDRGMLSMARSRNPNSASSQFFICHKPAPHLNGKYTVFGKVIKGLDIVDKIATAETHKTSSPTTRKDAPKKPIRILSTKVYKWSPKVKVTRN